MQPDIIGAQKRCSANLFCIRGNKKADRIFSGVCPIAFRKRAPPLITSRLPGRHWRSNETTPSDELAGRFYTPVQRHLQVQGQLPPSADQPNIRILDMAAILAKMQGTISPRSTARAASSSSGSASVQIRYTPRCLQKSSAGGRRRGNAPDEWWPHDPD